MNTPNRRWRADIYDRLVAKKDYAAEARKLHGIIQERNPGASSLLDVACGTGRHLESLLQFYRAEGLDASQEMLDAAKLRLPDVPLHQSDMSAFALGRTFDAVTCLFSSIACLPTVEALRQAIDCMSQHLAGGGVLIIEPWDEPADYSPESALWVERVDDDAGTLVCVETTRLDSDRWISDAHYLLYTNGHIEHIYEQEQLGAFTAADFACAFEAAGLTFERDEFGLIGRGLFIGQKPAP